MTTSARIPASKPIALGPVPDDGAPSERSELVSPALPVDLATLPDDVLAVLAIEAPREVERRRNERETAFLESVRAQAQALGVSPDRLRAALLAKSAPRPRAGGTRTDGVRRVPPKYRNPNNAAQVWSGRGVQPRWFADHLAAGGTKAECEIAEGAA